MFEIVLIAVCIVVVTAYSLKYFKHTRKIAGQINKLPGPKTYPIFGSSLEFSGVPPTKRLQHYETLARKYGYLFRSWWGSAPLVHILNAEDAEVLLSSQRNINKSINYKAHEIYLGTGLLTASGLLDMLINQAELCVRQRP